MNQQSRTVMKSGTLLVSAIALTTLISSPARARGGPPPFDDPVECSTNNLSGASNCLGSFSGNDSKSEVNDNVSFGINNWREFSKIDLDNDSYSNSNLTVELGEGDEEDEEDEDENEAIQGTWSLNGLNSNSDYMVALKGGPSYSLYYLGRGQENAGGSWNTSGLNKVGDGKTPGLSHFTVYQGNTEAVPEPTTILGVMLAGGIGAWCKNKFNQS